jgi:glutaredoxin
MITLYTIDCPKCKILEKKLEQANIKYETCKDREVIASKGFDLMPVLDVDGQIMGFGEAVKWVNERG